MNPQQRYRLKLRAEGRCRSCGKPTEDGGMYCADHRRIVRAYRAERIAAGRCMSCSSRAAMGYVHCHEHIEARRLQRMERERVAAWGYLLRCRVERGQPDVI